MMAKPRGSALTDLPPTLHPEQRLTAAQAQKLTGRGKSKFYQDVKDGVLPPPCERSKRFSRWRAGDLITALNGGR